MAVAAVAVLIAPAASADTAATTPFIDHARWVSYAGLPTLRIYPTTVGRSIAGELDKTAAETAEAWHEVLALAPDADTPGMRAQFICHWNFAEIAQPGKTSWDLEPWRPAVDDNTMILAGCNPGGSERA